MNSTIWDQIYQDGHEQKYPWDSVVSFIFRNSPKNINREQVKILEVGFGTASNLWFAAREKFDVYGIEGSSLAVGKAQKRFLDDGLMGNLRVGDFSSLPYEDNTFDLVIDRAALTCVGKKAQKETINEIRRCLKPGGKFLYNCYSDSHSSYRNSQSGIDGVRLNITEGTLIDVGQIYFSSRSDIEEFFIEGWKLHQVQRREWTDMLYATSNIHAEWLIVAEKIL